MKYLCWAILSCCMAMSLMLSQSLPVDVGCTSTENRKWGEASQCYDASHHARKAVGNSGYYSSKRFPSSNCSGVYWWTEFTKPVHISGISFEEGAGKEGGEFNFWGYFNGTNVIDYIKKGTADALSKWIATDGNKYDVYGLTRKGCTEFSTAGEYYWSIRNFKFTIKL